MSSMWKLPEEIQVDIFLRLPINSILACRCVCKPLCSLLSKPSFIKNHLNRSIQSNNPRIMLHHSQYHQRHDHILYSVDYKSISSFSASSFSELKVVPMDYPFESKKPRDIITLGSCDGIICLGISSGGMGIDAKNWVCIWNPSTGQYRNIKMHLSEFQDGLSSRVRYGFGYDSNIDDYKLVRISGHDNCWGKGIQIQVYTLGSKCWKTIQSTECYMFSAHFFKNIHGVLIKGVLHWLGVMATTQGTSSELIVCFDINNERLMDVRFPEETMLPPQQHQNMYREVGVLGECLSVVSCVMDIRTDIWVMQDYGVRQSWVKVYTINELTITRDPLSKLVWSFGNGDILVYACNQLMLYDKNNGQIRKAQVHGVNMSRYPESYVDSLVSFNSRTYVKKRTTDGNKKKPKRHRT